MNYYCKFLAIEKLESHLFHFCFHSRFEIYLQDLKLTNLWQSIHPQVEIGSDSELSVTR